MKKRIKAYFLAGPTGVGKTQFAIDLAKKINGAVLTVDSVQVYQGMDIGTAKPTLEEQQGIPHYLTDLISPITPFNVHEFIFHANRALEEVISKDQVPIFSGGTGFYFRALLEGLPNTPKKDEKLREELEKEETTKLFERLRQLDFEYSQTITHNDRQRIVRALEIIELTKKKVSTFAPSKPEGLLSELEPHAYFLTRPREEIYHRLEKRAIEMCEGGLLDEVKALMDLGFEQNPSAARAIAYQEPLLYLKNQITYEEMIKMLQKANRNYAKRQWTWFRGDPLFKELDLNQKNSLDAL